MNSRNGTISVAAQLAASKVFIDFMHASLKEAIKRERTQQTQPPMSRILRAAVQMFRGNHLSLTPPMDDMTDAETAVANGVYRDYLQEQCARIVAMLDESDNA